MGSVGREKIYLLSLAYSQHWSSHSPPLCSVQEVGKVEKKVTNSRKSDLWYSSIQLIVLATQNVQHLVLLNIGLSIRWSQSHRIFGVLMGNTWCLVRMGSPELPAKGKSEPWDWIHRIPWGRSSQTLGIPLLELVWLWVCWKDAVPDSTITIKGEISGGRTEQQWTNFPDKL